MPTGSREARDINKHVRQENRGGIPIPTRPGRKRQLKGGGAVFTVRLDKDTRDTITAASRRYRITKSQATRFLILAGRWDHATGVLASIAKEKDELEKQLTAAQTTLGRLSRKLLGAESRRASSLMWAKKHPEAALRELGRPSHSRAPIVREAVEAAGGEQELLALVQNRKHIK